MKEYWKIIYQLHFFNWLDVMYVLTDLGKTVCSCYVRRLQKCLKHTLGTDKVKKYQKECSEGGVS